MYAEEWVRCHKRVLWRSVSKYKKYHKRWRKKDLAILEAFVEGGGDMPYDNTVAAAAPQSVN